MRAAVLCLSISATLAFVLDRTPTDQKKTANAEQKLHDQLKRDKEFVIELLDGEKLRIQCNEARGRKLICSIITIFDKKSNLKMTLLPKDADVSLDEKGNLLLIQVDDCDFFCPDGTKGWVESRIFSYSLPPKK